MILLATWLWQGMAVAIGILALLSVIPRIAAATRHGVWWAGLTAVTLLPLASLAPRVAATGSVLEPAAPQLAGAAVPLPAAPAAAVLALAAAWLAVALVSLLRVALSVRAVHRLKRRSTPLPPERAARLRMWSASDTSRRRPELHVSRDIRAASALGLGRPVILLAPSVLSLDDDSLDAVVMHEYAHLARFDDWTQLAQALVTAVLALHPAIWYIGRRISLEREAACDDFVLVHGAAARRYARSLVELADAAPHRWATVAIPGATRSRSELRERVHRLLDGSRSRDRRLARPVFVASSLLAALAVAVAAQTPAVVVFVEAHVPAPPVAAMVRAVAAAPRFVGIGSLVTTEASVAAQRAPVPPATTETIARNASGAEQAAPAPLPAVAPAPLAPLPRAHGPAKLSLVERAAEPPPSSPSSASPPGLADPWVAVGHSASDAAQSTGNGVKNAGVSIGRFFGRAGKAIAGRF